MSKGRNTTFIGIRMPDILLDELKKRSLKNKMSLSAFIRTCMADKFSINMAEKRLNVKRETESKAELNEIKSRIEALHGEMNAVFNNINYIARKLGVIDESGNLLQG